MAFEKNVEIFGQYTAATDLSTQQFRLVKLSGLAIEICNTGTDKTIGVLYNTPSAGSPAEVAFGGIAKFFMSGACTAGDLIGAAGSGGGSAKTIGTESGHYICGLVVEGGAAGGIGTALLAGVPRRAS